MLTPSERKKEVALGLTFEHHLLARPSLATVEMYKQKWKIAQRTKMTQLQHETSTSLLSVSNFFFVILENSEPVLAGDELSAQALKEKNASTK